MTKLPPMTDDTDFASLSNKSSSTIKVSRELIHYLIDRHANATDKLSKGDYGYRYKKSRYQAPNTTLLTKYGYIRSEAIRLVLFLLSRATNGSVILGTEDLYSSGFDLGCRCIIQRTLCDLVSAGIISYKYDRPFRLHEISFVGYEKLGRSGDVSRGYLNMSRAAIQHICSYQSDGQSWSLHVVRVYILTLINADSQIHFTKSYDNTEVTSYEYHANMRDFVRGAMPEYLHSRGRVRSFFDKFTNSGIFKAIILTPTSITFGLSGNDIGRIVMLNTRQEFEAPLDHMMASIIEAQLQLHDGLKNQSFVNRTEQAATRLPELFYYVLNTLGIQHYSQIHMEGIADDISTALSHLRIAALSRNKPDPVDPNDTRSEKSFSSCERQVIDILSAAVQRVMVA